MLNGNTRRRKEIGTEDNDLKSLPKLISDTKQHIQETQKTPHRIQKTKTKYTLPRISYSNYKKPKAKRIP